MHRNFKDPEKAFDDFKNMQNSVFQELQFITVFVLICDLYMN